MTKYVVAFLIALIPLSISLSPEMVAVLPEVNNATMMDISGGEMFVLDGVEVKVYSLKDYCLKRKFGKRGEGPGELVTTPDTSFTMIVNQDKVILNSVYKAIVYDKSGTMIKEVKFYKYIIEAVPMGENFIVTKFMWYKYHSAAITSMYSPEFKDIKRIYRTYLLQNYEKKKYAMPPLGTFVRCTSDRIFLFDQQKDTIQVFDTEGNSINEIKFPYERMKSDYAFKKKVNDAVKLHPVLRHADPEFLEMIYTPEVQPLFRDCRVIGDRLYVQTYRLKGEKSEFLIIDFAGKVEKRLFLPVNDRLQIRYNPASIYDFYDGLYYYLKEDIDEEEWELHVQELN